ALKTAIKQMTLPVWIKTTVDPTGEGYPYEAEAVQEAYRSIQIADAELEGFDYDVSVDVESLSPVGQAMKRNDWNQVLQIISQPGAQALLGRSETMLRKTLEMYGIRDDREIAEIQQALASLTMPQQPRAMPGQPQEAAPGPTPAPGEIPQQLAQQMT